MTTKRKINEQKTTDSDDAVATIEPLLMALKDRGFTGIVECSTIDLGRDVVILNRLARRTGLHILTNTGGYAAFGDAFTVTYVVEDDPNLIAARWIYESEVGIDGTGIKPGFIKIAVDPGPLSDLDRKLVQAAAKTHLQTGLTIACHTGEAQAAIGALQTAISEGVDPSALIVVHSSQITDEGVLRELADAGWYNTADPKGWMEFMGEMYHPTKGSNQYLPIADQLMPALTRTGMSNRQIQQLVKDNPAKAFTIRIRAQ